MDVLGLLQWYNERALFVLEEKIEDNHLKNVL